MKKLDFEQEEFSLLSDSDYSIDTELAIQRRTIYRTAEDNLVAQRKYLIDGKKITVNSVFNMPGNQSAVNGIRHLIDRDLQQKN